MDSSSLATPMSFACAWLSICHATLALVGSNWSIRNYIYDDCIPVYKVYYPPLDSDTTDTSRGALAAKQRPNSHLPAAPGRSPLITSLVHPYCAQCTKIEVRGTMGPTRPLDFPLSLSFWASTMFPMDKAQSTSRSVCKPPRYAPAGCKAFLPPTISSTISPPTKPFVTIRNPGNITLVPRGSLGSPDAPFHDSPPNQLCTLSRPLMHT